MADIRVDEERRDGRHHDRAYHDAPVAAPAGLLKRISWGAILAGTVVALGVTALLGLLGLAIGFRVVDPASGSSPFNGVGIGTAIWWMATSIIALGIGGYIAGRASGLPDRNSATSHGAAVWGLVTIITLWMATSAIGSVLNTATSAVGTALRTTANIATSVGGAIIPDNINLSSPQAQQARQAIQQEVNQMLGQAGIGQQELQQAGQVAGNTARDVLTNPGNAGAEIQQMVDRLFAGPNAVISPEERQRLEQALAQRTGVPPEQARQAVDRWQQQAQAAQANISQTVTQVRDQAGQTAENALDIASTVAWYAFLASLLSMIAAIVCAAIGAPRHTFVHDRI